MCASATIAAPQAQHAQPLVVSIRRTGRSIYSRRDPGRRVRGGLFGACAAFQDVRGARTLVDEQLRAGFLPDAKRLTRFFRE